MALLLNTVFVSRAVQLTWSSKG